MKLYLLLKRPMTDGEILQAMALASWQVPPFSIHDTIATREEELQNTRQEQPAAYLEKRTVSVTLEN